MMQAAYLVIRLETLCLGLILCARPSLAAPVTEGAARHAHTEAGHFAGGLTAEAARYVDTEPPLWANLGTLSYPITTGNPRAQQYFDLGLRLRRRTRWAV